ncbi:MAG: hypothetical protein AAGB18_04110 [Pseudomonadota bacterium]
MTQEPEARAALAVLVVLQTIMLTALYSDLPPHPPATTPIFGMAPFLGMSISLAVAALVLGSASGKIGPVLAVLAMLAALVSFGPQKYADPQFPLIWPAVVTAQVTIVLLTACLARDIRAHWTRSR